MRSESRLGHMILDCPGLPGACRDLGCSAAADPASRQLQVATSRSPCRHMARAPSVACQWAADCHCDRVGLRLEGSAPAPGLGFVPASDTGRTESDPPDSDDDDDHKSLTGI